MNESQLAAQTGSNSAVIAFVAYIGIVMLLAWLSGRVTKKGSFLSEYFLGGRNLGVWAFALTFAATSASGGSFIGFPSLVYSHGWSVALWICSYMLVPLVAMGLLAKRLNQVARKADAITIPDLIQARFNSPALGLLSTILIVFFMAFNLIAQFKGGSVILQTLLSDVPIFQSAASSLGAATSGLPLVGTNVDPAYLLCLIVFALAVVVYTTYGGFRAVVWTDVLQGFVMVIGILLLLPMSLIAAGGLKFVTTQMHERPPAKPAEISLSFADEELWGSQITADRLIAADHSGEPKVFRLLENVQINRVGSVFPTPYHRAIEALELSQTPDEIQNETVLSAGFVVTEYAMDLPYASGMRPGSLTFAPGPSKTKQDGFLPFTAAISFFFFWCFASAGQPSNMVRCMAFKDSKTLGRAIFTVSIYFSLIYFPIVIIFCCAKTILPGWEHASDRIMPEMTSTVTSIFGVPWLAGLLVAAPFAAVMSTMDSFLLMISSSVVRDIYQRWINPNPSARRIKLLTYSTTFIVGVVAMLAAIQPPQFLQDIIVFTGSGLATSFLAPVTLALYWPRFNHQGAIAGMLTGFLSNIALYGIGTWANGSMSAYQPLGFHPFLVGSVLSLVVAWSVCNLTRAPDKELVLRFFFRRRKTQPGR